MIVIQIITIKRLLPLRDRVPVCETLQKSGSIMGYTLLYLTMRQYFVNWVWPVFILYNWFHWKQDVIKVWSRWRKECERPSLFCLEDEKEMRVTLDTVYITNCHHYQVMASLHFQEYTDFFSYIWKKTQTWFILILAIGSWFMISCDLVCGLMGHILLLQNRWQKLTKTENSLLQAKEVLNHKIQTGVGG